MTNKDLRELKNKLHKSLIRNYSNQSLVCIRETGNESVIKEMKLIFKNKDDALIICQNPNTCGIIHGLFQSDKIASCDFIVLISRGSKLYIYFCELKSSNTEINRIEAMKQIKSSELFLDFVFKNYNHHFRREVFNLSECEIRYLMLYPAPFSQKKRVSPDNGGLNIKSIKCDNNGCVAIPNGYEFFEKITSF